MSKIKSPTAQRYELNRAMALLRMYCRANKLDHVVSRYGDGVLWYMDNPTTGASLQIYLAPYDTKFGAEYLAQIIIDRWEHTERRMLRGASND